jgi:hypothetical protein
LPLLKLSLWLVTLAKEHDFTFLEHALREGDSLVGLSRERFAGLHWKARAPLDLFRHHMQPQMEQILSCRADLLALDDETPALLKEQKLKMADGVCQALRRAGDVVVAAFFSAGNDKQREARLTALSAELAGYHERRELKHLMPLSRAAEGLRSGPKGVVPFHWEVEFPEVFRRENPGFDCILGNPPFLGGTMISTSHGDAYKDWLYEVFPQSGNRMDLVAYFFRRGFQLLRDGGCLGLIATNTIAQGDTRKGGLRFICSNGGKIYSVRRRHPWPGLAAVIVSVLHIAKGEPPAPYDLDGQSVDRITAFLFHQGGHNDPFPLQANEHRSFEGFKIAGQGFLFDDSDHEASPLRVMRGLLQDQKNSQRIYPYIGGEEVNDSPTHTPHRHVIDFADLTLEEAEKWPELLAIVREKVKPYRNTVKRDVHRLRWWQYGERRPGLRAAMSGLEKVLVCSMVSKHLAFAFLPSTWVYSHALNVFAISSFTAFCVMQSCVHEAWARFFASSMKDDMRYTPSDCFETFPFPADFETQPALEEAGEAYYTFRADLMRRNNEGLTKTYNRFHDQNERSPDILRLRELHAAMDRAVLDAYGWTDLRPTCEFLLDYEDAEDEEETSGRQRKKPWRYRWPDDFRDEVLARLLELNRQRAEQERLAGPAEKGAKGSRKRKASKAEGGERS